MKDISDSLRWGGILFETDSFVWWPQAAVLGIAPTYGPHAARLAPTDARGGVLPGGYSPDSDTDADEGRSSFSGPAARAHTMFAWRDPVSPHIAAATEGKPVDWMPCNLPCFV